MSHKTPGSTANSSMFAAEDTFLNAKRRPQISPNVSMRDRSAIPDLTANPQTDRASDANSSTYIPQLSNISSYTPIKPLVDSPFKSTMKSPKQGSTTLSFTNNTETNVSQSFLMSSPSLSNHQISSSSLLKDKVRQSQYDNSKLYLSSNSHSGLANPSIYQSSIFRSRRALNTPTLDGNRVLYQNVGSVPGSQSHLSGPNVSLPPVSGISSEGTTEDDLNSPYVEMALKRIVNRDQETRTVLVNGFLVLVYKFFLAVVRLFIASFQVHKINVISKNSEFYYYASYLNYLVYGILFFNIITSLIKLLKPEDKCLDLPLTDKQRKLLGLPLLSSNDDSDKGIIPPLPGTSSAKSSSSSLAPLSALDKPTVIKPMDNVKLSETSLQSISAGRDTSFAAMDISRSFASMNLTNHHLTGKFNNNNNNSANLSSYNQSRGLANSTSVYNRSTGYGGGPNTSSSELIKQRLLQSRQLGNNVASPNNAGIMSAVSGSPNRSILDQKIKRPSSKFLYDLKNGNDSGYVSDLSLY
ncbi:unnamed protein product [Ambrosiozyma monospora]|uniref:Unnamed protein product n=1 Tax=Ambrosiozyma monospora TaxID=43982 RepID=A0ACB5SUH1_AMBMO|nr:unnamed protein product [Ambrosiozyma monospora]